MSANSYREESPPSLTHLRPEIVFGTLNIYAKRLPVLANGGLLHTTRGENWENTLLSTEEVPLQPDSKIINSENRPT